MNRFVKILFSLPRTIWFNIRYIPLKQAIKFPIWIANNVRIKNMYRGGIVVANDATLGLIRIGYHKVDAVDTYALHTILDVRKGGRIIFNSDAHIGHGAILSVKNGAVLSCGDNFAISGTTSIVCSKNITIGHDVQFSWDTLVMDSDAHVILDENNRELPNSASIFIGNKVWIAARNTILKGTEIQNNCVVASSSLLNKQYGEENVIIAGTPARIVKKIAGWHL